MYLILGLITFRPPARLSEHTLRAAEVVSLINRWLHSLLPQLTWTSIAISRNARLEVHADRGNAEGSSNITVTLGQFSDGQLWLEHASGDVRMPCSDSANAMGIVVDTHMRPYVFCPRTRHATMPFTGERWCLTAYTAADNVSLTPALQAKLEELCFPVPASSKASHVQTPQAEPAMLLTSSSANLRQVLLGPEPATIPPGPPAPTSSRIASSSSGSEVRRVCLFPGPASAFPLLQPWPRTNVAAAL